MELRHYINLVRKWLWLIVLCTVLAGAAAYVLSRQQTPIYEATATVLINQARSATRGTEYADILSSERIARTYAELLQDWPVLQEAASQFGFEDDYQAMSEQYQLSVAVTPVRDTQLVKLSVEANNPEVAALVANTLPDVFMRINQERQRDRYEITRQELQTELSTVEENIAATQQVLDSLGDADTPEISAQRSRLESALNRYEASYISLLNSLEELRLAEVQTTDNIVLTTPAQVPENPIRPRSLFNALLAAMIGAMLAVGTAFLIEYLDDTIKNPDEVRDLVGLPTLGAVVALSGDSPQKRLVAQTDPRSPAAEAYRVLRTNLQFSSLDTPLRAIVVTSPGPGEGKSTTAANLALVMAQAGNSVLLLDADLRRPNVHRLFQLPNSTGLTTALLNIGHDLDSSIQKTPNPKLHALTTGPIPPNPAELLSSSRMQELIKQLQEQYDVLVIDSPPVLAVADATIISKQVDGLLMVLSAGETRADMLARAMEQLDSVNVRPLGVVLNRLTERKGGTYYYYYYQYTSRYGPPDEEGDRGDGGSGRLRRPRSPRASEQAP
jgi:non-specific protein-tyrosine kinase